MKYLGAIFLCLLLFVGGCTSNNENIDMPEDFDYVLKYGVNAKNELNTFSHTYTREMVTDPPITVHFKLSDEEMQKIYNEMKK